MPAISANTREHKMQQYFVDRALEVDPREDKLPVWAKEKLTTLRRAATEARNELGNLRGGTEPGRFWLEDWNHGQRFYLPKNAGRLMYGDPHTGSELEFSISSQSPEGWLSITGHGVIVAPWVSNVLLIKGQPE